MGSSADRDSFTFLHAADVHLDSPLRGLARYEGAPVEAIRGATRSALVNLVDLALEQAVDFVLIAGDLYDGDQKDFNTALFFTGQMARLADAGVAVFLIAGNHDAESQITRRLRLPGNVHRFATHAPQTHCPEGLAVAVHGQGFARRDVTDDLSKDYPPPLPGRFNIGLLHTALSGREGHAPYAPCTVEGLRGRGYDYWALGHVHRREVVSEAPWIVFPGNLQGRHARETGAKGATRVTVREGQVSAVEHVPLDQVRWFHAQVDVSGAADLDDALARMESALGQAARDAQGRLAAVRVTLSGPCPAHARLRAERERVEAECRALATVHGGGMWLERVQVRTRAERSVDEALARDDALGGLLRAIQALEADAQVTGMAEALFADLKRKLSEQVPQGGEGGEEGLDPVSPEALREALDDVKALLVQRLLVQEDL